MNYSVCIAFQILLAIQPTSISLCVRLTVCHVCVCRCVGSRISLNAFVFAFPFAFGSALYSLSHLYSSNRSCISQRQLALSTAVKADNHKGCDTLQKWGRSHQNGQGIREGLGVKLDGSVRKHESMKLISAFPFILKISLCLSAC